jgi:hypothetical protein
VIIKGKSRAGPSQLARHLGRTDTNERVAILQLDSAGTPEQAFRDWQTYTLATNGRLGLYHANIDPDARYAMTADQWMRAVDILEEELGLQGQPRAVVMHEKNGREHIHVVWARADMEAMRLRSDSNNYLAHERASMRMEQEFGHEHVPGKHAKRDREKQPEFPRAEVSHYEWQQTERQNPDGGGIGHRDRKAQVTALYEASDNGPAFKAALEDAGYVLARGDRRDFVILDSDAKVHSLGRQLPGIKAAELRAFMVDVNPETLPGVKEARSEIRAAARMPQREPPQPEGQAGPSAPQVDDRRTAMLQALAERHGAGLAEQERRHAQEVAALQDAQDGEARRAFDDFATEHARRLQAERPPEPGAFQRFWQTVREAISDEARGQRLLDEARRAEAIDERREQEIRIMVSGLEYKHRAELERLYERQAHERAELLREQDKDTARRIKDDERARALEREYEKRDREARDREGPDRGGGRAR